MGLESFTGIWSLNPANPVGATDRKSQGDDHFRGIKYTLQFTWPNVRGVVTASDGEMNMLVGVTSAIQAQFDGKAPKLNPTFTGTTTIDVANLNGLATFGVSPRAPTPTAGDSSTKLATTAFVAAAAFSSGLPAISGATAYQVVSNDGATGGWSPRQGHYLYLYTTISDL